MYNKANHLFPRAMFDSPSCPNNYEDDSVADPLTGNLTFHDLITYIAAGLTAITLLMGTFLVSKHVRHYTNPFTQRHLLRIIVGVYIFAGLSLVGVASYKATQYVESILELYQVFLLFSLFHLYLEYLVPNSTWEDKIAHFSDPAHGGLRLFKVRYISVVQVLPVKIVCMVVTIIATTVNCWLDESWKKVTLIVSVLSLISVGLALSAIVPLAIKTRNHLRRVDSKVVGKFVAIQILTIGQVAVNLILRILSKANKLEATTKLSYNDLNVGIAALATNILALVSAVVMLSAYNLKQSAQHPKADIPLESQPGSDEGSGRENEKPRSSLGCRRALGDTLNPSDVFISFWRAAKLFAGKFDKH